jgi:hypothetical protein
VALGVAQPWKHNGSYTPLPPTPVDPSLSYTLTVLGQNYNQFCILAQGGNQALRVGAYQFTLMDEQPIEILQPSTGVSLFPIGSQFTPPAQNSDGGFSATIILPSAGVTLSDGQQGCIRMNTALYNNSVNIGGLIPLNAPVFVNGISIPISGFNPNTTDPTPGIATLSDYTTWGGTTPPQSTFVHRTNTVVYRDMIFDVNGTITANTYDAPAQFRTLQSQNPNANGRFLAFLGGYGTGDTTAQIANATANAFATNIQAMVHHGFDGLVFDPDVVGAKTPITGAQLVSMATTIASRVPQLTIIVPGSEYGLSRLQPLGAWCDAAAPYNVRLVRATNFAWGTGANGKSMTDDQTALRMNPANPTADRTSSFTDSTSRLRQLCPTLNPRKFGGTVYTDGVATTVDPTNWGPEGNGRYAFAVKDVGDQGFVQLKDLAGGNFPFTNLQCTWTGDNPDYSNVTQTPYCFTPIGNIYVTFTDAQSARLIAKAAQANGHGSISISSSSGQAGDAPLGRGYSIADAVYGVFNPANATASAATPQPSAQPQAAATVDSVAESKSVAVSVPAIPADLSNQLVTAISQGALHSVASTLGRETVVATLQKRGYTEEDARAISTQWNYLLNAAILLACGASLGTALAVPTLITVLEALGVKSEKASGLASALIATVNVCNAKYTMVEMLSQWGISGAMLKNFAVLGVNTACSVAASIFTSRAGRPIINALATAADKIISNPIVQYCANSKAAAAVQYAGSAVSYGFFGVGKALGKSAVLVVDVAQGGYGLLCSAAGMFRSKPVGAPVPASALKHVTVVPTQKM